MIFLFRLIFNMYKSQEIKKDFIAYLTLINYSVVPFMYLSIKFGIESRNKKYE